MEALDLKAGEDIEIQQPRFGLRGVAGAKTSRHQQSSGQSVKLHCTPLEYRRTGRAVGIATVVPQVPLGYLTLWPFGGAQPLVSTLNAGDQAITSNMAIVPTNNAEISGYASGPGATYLILDISGYFAP